MEEITPQPRDPDGVPFLAQAAPCRLEQAWRGGRSSRDPPDLRPSWGWSASPRPGLLELGCARGGCFAELGGQRPEAGVTTEQQPRRRTGQSPSSPPGGGCCPAALPILKPQSLVSSLLVFGGQLGSSWTSGRRTQLKGRGLSGLPCKADGDRRAVPCPHGSPYTLGSHRSGMGPGIELLVGLNREVHTGQL